MIKKVIDLLKMAGIDYSKMAGKVDPNKIKQLVTQTQKTSTKPKLIDALVADKGTFADALKIFETDATYLSQMDDMQLVNFANNLEDYFKVGGKKKNLPKDNVVSTKGAPVVGKQFENLASRKGGAGPADETSFQGAVQGLMTLVDDIKGISPKMRNQMNRDELAAFIQKMRGKKFTNDEIKWVRNYMDEWGIGMAKSEAAPAMQYAKKLGAKSNEEVEFVREYLDNIKTTSPEKFKEMFGNVKTVNMDINTAIEKKLENFFKKKHKWDDSKGIDGGLDDIAYEKYEDELYEAQKQFSTLSRRKTGRGVFDEESWGNHPNNYLEEASDRLESITGEKLNVGFWKNYTDDVLNKYKVEEFNQGGRVLAASGGLIDVLKL